MSTQEDILNKIKNVLGATAPQSEIILYGSRAKGNATVQSDWDILVLLNSKQLNFDFEKQIIDALYEIEIETGAVISPLIYTKTEWNDKHSITPLFENINREGIRIN